MNREATIRQIHAAATPETLESLANKGLLRRAGKDLERGEVGAFAMEENGLSVTVGGHRVTLVEAGPAKAHCTCPAPGVCQHILAACLQLMTEPSAAPTGSARYEWLAISATDLLAAFGLPTLRAAHELSLAHEANVVDAGTLTVRFPTLNAEVIALPGAGLAGIIVNGPAERRIPLIAATALLAVRRAAGIDWEPPELAGTAAVPLHRDAVLTTAAALLEEAIASGLARLAPALVERFDAVAVSAQATGLHRLGLLLQRVATEASDWLQRRPHADLSRLFGEMATAYALVHAAPNLAAGTARESYVEIGGIDLTGVAAWPWETPSGYQGLTLLLWDAANSQWNTWTDARPKAFQGDFTGTARFFQPGPWEGAESPAQLARSKFRLVNAKRNRWGRLSSSSQSKALITGTASLADLPATTDWSQLAAAPAIGLRERDPRAAFQVLQPAAWLRRPFDPISQSLEWQLLDTNGSPLEMQLAFSDLARPAIHYFEALDPAVLDGARLLARCFHAPNQWLAQPLALICGATATSFFFDIRKKPTAPNPIKPAPGPPPQADDDDLEEAEPGRNASAHSATARLAFAAISALEWLAESGLRARQTEAFERLDELSRQTDQLGLTKLAAILRPVKSPAAWLRLRWLLGLLLATPSSADSRTAL